MIPVFIALGSNIEPRLTYLTAAVDQLHTFGEITKIAALYESTAYGVEDQPAFFNSACILNTKVLPLDLLESLKAIEKKLGRKQRTRWARREIDLDIVFYNQEIIREKELVIPHPDYKNRRFVLQPLADLDANFKPPGEHKNIKQLLDSCPDNTEIELKTANWYHQWK